MAKVTSSNLLTDEELLAHYAINSFADLITLMLRLRFKSANKISIVQVKELTSLVIKKHEESCDDSL